MEFKPDRLVFTNPSVMTGDDWDHLTTAAKSGKYEEGEQTGEFGVGFWSVLHLTDVPIVSSESITYHIDPLAEDGFEAVELPAPLDGCRFELPYRTSQTTAADKLDVKPMTRDDIERLEEEFVGQLEQLLLFTRAITEIRITGRDGRTVTATRAIHPVTDRVAELLVTIHGDGAERQHVHYVISTEIDNVPARRHPRVQVAIPADLADTMPGLVFCTFPTKAATGTRFAINAAFQPTEDRRDIADEGERGDWNRRLFTEAGRMVGAALPELMAHLPAGPAFEAMVGRFARVPEQGQQTRDRADLCLLEVDRAVRDLPVLRDRAGELRVPTSLGLLDVEVDGILGGHVKDVVVTPKSEVVAHVMTRWGVRRWGPEDVAVWLRLALPKVPTSRKAAPVWAHDIDDLLALLNYCGSLNGQIEGVLLALGTDDRLYPIGSPELPKVSSELQSLVGGLDAPLLNERLARTVAGHRAEQASALWFVKALRDVAERFDGARVPTRKLAVLSQLDNAHAALELLVEGGCDPRGTPLAVAVDKTVRIWDSQKVVFNLPKPPARKAVAAFAERLGFVPLHDRVDDTDVVRRCATEWTGDLLAERLAELDEWEPAEDCGPLLLTLLDLQRSRTLGGDAIEAIRALPLWPDANGATRALAELYLQPETVLAGGGDAPLLDPKLYEGDLEVRELLRSRLRVDVYDTTEDLVQDAERGGRDTQAALELMEELCRAELSPAQHDRLRVAKFVPCRDGQLRAPSAVFLTAQVLPPPLEDARADADVANGRLMRKFVKELGAPELPCGDDLFRCAEHIATLPIEDGGEKVEPSRMLFELLTRHVEAYTQPDLRRLSAVPWMASTPGPQRRRPQDLLTPDLAFAGMLMPVPTGVATPATALRQALQMRASISAQECVDIARHAAASKQQLGKQFFAHIERDAANDASAVLYRSLKDEPIIPVGNTFVRPADLAVGEQAAIWGHLKSRLSDDELVTRFSRIFGLWGVVVSDDEPHWRDHAAVLEALAARDLLSGMDQQLALARMQSLAEAVGRGEVQAKQLARLECVLTSQGVVSPGTAYSRDLPYHQAQMLQEHLPVIDAQAPAGLLTVVTTKSLRVHVKLSPIAPEPVDDREWSQALRVKRLPTVRYLMHFAEDLPDELLETWPPVVKRTTGLLVRATLSGRTLAEWPEEAFLQLTDADGAVLFVAGAADIRGVVDAIKAELGLLDGTAALLANVLSARSDELAHEWLDGDNVPPLTQETIALVGDMVEVTIADDIDLTAVDPIPVEARVLPEVGTQETDATGAAGGDVDNAPPLYDAVAPLPPRPQTPAGYTDHGALQDRGVGVDWQAADDDPGDALTGEGERTPPSELTLVLSWYDHHHGLLSGPADRLEQLAGGRIRRVHVLGQEVEADRAGESVRLAGGAELYEEHEIVPGTVFRLYPGAPGSLEVELREDPHEVSNVFWLDIDEDGKLIREQADSVQVRWETNGAVYKAERRFEDLDALYEELLASGKSAKQLLIEVFQDHGQDGFTVDEAWEAVAMYRMFAVGTIKTILHEQTEAFEQRDGRWHLLPDPTLVQRSRSRGSSSGSDAGASASRPSDGTGTSSPTPRSRSARGGGDSTLDLAHKLAVRMRDADESTRDKVWALLEDRSDTEFAERCREVLESLDPNDIDQLANDIELEPELAATAMHVLEETGTDPEPLGTLTDAIRDYGGTSIKARVYRYLTGPVAPLPRDLGAADLMVWASTGFSQGRLSSASLVAGAAESMRRLGQLDPVADGAKTYDEFCAVLRALEDVRSKAQLNGQVTPDVNLALNALLGVLLSTHADVGVEGLRVRSLARAVLRHPVQVVLEDVWELGKVQEREHRKGDARESYRFVKKMAGERGLGDRAFVKHAAAHVGGLDGKCSDPQTDFLKRLGLALGRP